MPIYMPFMMRLGDVTS